MGAFDDLPTVKGKDPFADLPDKKQPGVADRVTDALKFSTFPEAEAATHIASSAFGAAAGGITALATGDPDAVEPVAESLTYEPRTGRGKAYAGSVQKAFQAIDEFGDWSGEKLRELAPRDPRAVALATAWRTLVNLVPGFVLPEALRGRARSAERPPPRPEPSAEPSAQPAPTAAPPARDFPITEETPAVRPEGKVTRTKSAPGALSTDNPFADLPDLPKEPSPDVPGAPSAAQLLAREPLKELVPTGTPEGLARLKERTAQTEQEFRLEGESEDQFRARMLAENREREAAKARESAPPAEEFTLAGSDRATDQAAARGQMELAPPPESITGEGMTTEVKPTAFEKFDAARQAYRARKIGDDEFLAAKREWEQNQREFDASRGELPPEPEKPKPRARKEGPPASILTAIKGKGGIDIREILDLTGEGRTGKKGISPGLFTKKGTGLDDLATRLRSDGFDIPEDAADGGVQALRDMIQDELAGRRKHYSAYDQDRVAALEAQRRAKEVSDEVSTIGEDEFLTDEQALEKFGPGTLGMNLALNPENIRQAARDMKAGAKVVIEEMFGVPGQHRNLYGPIRDLEQTNVARIDRWAAGESHRIKQAFPEKAAREDLTRRLVRGDLRGLTGLQLEVAQKLQQNYKQMGDYAVNAERLDGLRQNYSPQIWDLSDKRTRALIQMWRDAREAGPVRETSPLLRDPSGSGSFSPFTLQRAISDVFEGMQMGLKPASLDASELFTTYARSMGRAVERSKAMTSLHELLSQDGDPMVMPVKQAPRGYVPIRYPELEGYAVHPDIAPAVRVVLESDTPGAIGIALQSAAYASKRGLVSYSFFHPMSLFLAWEGSFPKGSMLNPKGAIDSALKKYREGGPGDAVDKLLEGGLKLGAPLEDLMGRERFGRVMDKVERMADRIKLGGLVRVPRRIDRGLQHATWDYVQTGFKLDIATRFFEDQLVKNAKDIASGKITEKEIARQAAEAANGIQGGLNWERMIDKFDTPVGRRVMADILSKNGRRWAQTFAFAPDWLVSTVSTWTNAVTGGERAAVRRSLARRYLITSAIITYSYGNALNYYFTGHSMFENRSNKKGATWMDDMKAKTEVQLGGGLRINPNKHFLEVPHMAADPVQFMLNKANPLTVGEPLEQLFNQQWLSTGYTPPITEKGDKPGTRVAKRIGHVAGKVLPITGRSVMEHGALGAGGFLGFPVSGVSEEEKERERVRRTIQRSARP